MRELSMHILDLAQNSIAAGAKRLAIDVSADAELDLLTIAIKDDGRGMPPEFLAKVKDPFTTTRRTRRVGLGVPMMVEAAEACEGDVYIESEPGKGTNLVATFRLSHIDRAPLGDIPATLVSIMAVNPDLTLRYIQRVNGEEFVLDTDEVKAQLGDVPINEGPVLKWLGEYIKEQTSGEMQID